MFNTSGRPTAYMPTVTNTGKSLGRLRYPPPEEPNVNNSGATDAASNPTKTGTESPPGSPVFKIILIAFVGAATATSIALGITMLHHFSLSTTPSITSTTTTTTMTTTTTVTTTTTSVTTTTSTTSQTTTTTATTATTTTTTTTARITCTSPCTCAGVSSYTLWQQYSTTGIYMDVSTTSCNFSQTPRYMTSISGASDHWQLIGHNAIYSGSATTFRIYLNSIPGWSATTLQSLSTSNEWNVNWVGMYE